VAVLLSESVARSVGDELRERAARALLPVIRLVERTLHPVVVVGSFIERGLDTALPPRQADEVDRDATAEQFRQIVAAEAEVTREEATLLNGVFELGDTEVHEVMVPRVDILAIDREMPWSEVVDRVRSSQHSRLP